MALVIDPSYIMVAPISLRHQADKQSTFVLIRSVTWDEQDATTSVSVMETGAARGGHIGALVLLQICAYRFEPDKCIDIYALFGSKWGFVNAYLLFCFTFGSSSLSSPCNFLVFVLQPLCVDIFHFLLWSKSGKLCRKISTKMFQ